MTIPRAIETTAKRLISKYPVLTITGPRQSGKTTLCRMLFPDMPYFSLENPDIRTRAVEDPRRFLKPDSSGMVIDEIQRVPELLSYIQSLVDEHNRPGMFVLTGSAQFELMSGITQSLAGRTALLNLLPFSYNEIYRPDDPPTLDQLLYTGFFPRISDQNLNPSEAYAFYCSTYLERDVRSLLNIKDLRSFETFLKLCAGRTAQLLNISSLAADCGISHTAASNWMSVLEASFVVTLLRPHFRNFSKRLVKAPKLHLVDCGLGCYLTDVLSPDQLGTHPARGNLFETFVAGELIKQRLNRGQNNNLYYWRDNTGHEIDILMDFGTALFPVEVKAGTTFNPDFLKNINFYRAINPACATGAVVYGGDHSFIHDNVHIVGYRDIGIFDGLDYRLEIRLPEGQ